MPSVLYFSQISPFTQQLLCCILKIVNVKTSLYFLLWQFMGDFSHNEIWIYWIIEWP